MIYSATILCFLIGMAVKDLGSIARSSRGIEFDLVMRYVMLPILVLSSVSTCLVAQSNFETIIVQGIAPTVLLLRTGLVRGAASNSSTSGIRLVPTTLFRSRGARSSIHPTVSGTERPHHSAHSVPLRLSRPQAGVQA